MLIDDVCDSMAPAAAAHTVVDVRVGLGYTAAELDDGRCGLAYTLREGIAEGCGVVKAAGTLAGREASELVQWARSNDRVAAAIGLAVVNALAGVPAGAAGTDVVAALKVRPEDVVGMIGQFGPLLGPLRSQCGALHVIERRPRPEYATLAEASAAEILPQCDVAILSATTILNGTLDGLLALCRSAREVAILGPSTPMLPSVFAGRGVTLLSGVQVLDADRVLRIVSEGGGTRQFGGAVRKLVCRAA